MPVMEHVIKFGQIVRRRASGLIGIKALIHPPVLGKIILPPGGGHELPQPHGLGTRHRRGIVSAFHIGKAGQFLGQPLFPEHLARIGDIGAGTQQIQLDGPPVAVNVELEIFLHFHEVGLAQTAIQLPL